MRRLCRIIAADHRAVEVLTADEEADRALSGALTCIQTGAPFGYMTGARLEDYGRVEAIRVNLSLARALGVDDIDARMAAAVTAAGAIAEPWRGRWE